MKKAFFIVIILLCQVGSKAQDRFVINAGIENQFPVQNFKGFYNDGLGASLNAEYKISKRFSTLITPQYVLYFYNIKSLQLSGTTDFVSIFSGFKYHILKNIYLVAQAGVSRKLVKNSQETAFAYTGGAGMDISKKITAAVKYENIHANTSAPQTISLRLGYNLWGKN